MAMIRAVVHTYPGVADDPVAVLHYINRHFEFLWDSSMYATAVYAVVDAGKGTLRIASAGHPLPLKARCGDGVTPVTLDTTMCLLWNELDAVPCAEFPLTRGDRWVFYTDGITDRQSPDGTMFDLERLAPALASYCAKAPAAIVDAIISDLDAFSDGVEPDDDQTLLVVGFD
jgi:sigma-B regulation protein RsbU (phosphoserine phosphatase)